MPRGSPRSRRSTATRLALLSDAADAGDRRFYPDRFQEEACTSSAVIAAAALLVLALLLPLSRSRPIVAAGLVGTLAAAFVLPTSDVVVPGLDLPWLSRTAATLVARLPRTGEAVVSVGYSEPSLVFLLGTATRMATAAPGDRQLAGAGMALVGDREDAAFRKSLATRGLNFSAVDRVTGLDYSAGGGRVILTLYDLEPR